MATLNSVSIRYLLAVVMIALATAFRVFLGPAFGERVPFVTLFAAIMVSAYLGGLGPGLLSVVLGGIAVSTIPLAPGHPLLLDQPGGPASLSLYFAVGLVITTLSELTHRSRRQAESSAQDRLKSEQALLDSEERLRLALDSGQMGTWEWTIATGQVQWSPSLERIHGYAAGTFAGTFEGFQRDIHVEDRERVTAAIMMAVERREDYHVEYRIVCPDDSVRWLEARGTLYYDAEQRPVRMLGLCVDVTHRKQLEADLRGRVDALAAAEERVRSVVAHALDAIITVDDRGIIHTFNPAAERLFGRSATEVIGENVKMIIPVPHHGEFDDFFQNYLRPGRSRVLRDGRELRGKRPDGRDIALEVFVSEYHLAGRRYFTGVIHDISERKRTESTLRFLADASKLLSTLVDYRSTLQRVAWLAVPTFADWCKVDVLNSEGVLESLAVAHVDTTRAERLHELSRQFPPRLNAAHGAGRVARTGESELVEDVRDALRESSGKEGEGLVLKADFGPRSYICAPLTAQGRVLGVISFVYAESGRRYGPGDLAVAEDLAHRAAIALENARLYQQVREADRRKDEFLAMLAHELRNPLAPIRSGLDILAMEPQADSQTVAVMQQQLEHLIRLVDDLLDVSRIMRGRVELRKQHVNLAEVVHRAHEVVQPNLSSTGKSLEMDLPPTPIWLHADPVRVVQILENLFSNAVKYTDENGHIRLSAVRENGVVAISISDDGIGIEPDLLPNVFDLFTQSSRTLDRAQGGLGIGLTLVRTLVEMHGGTVSAESEGAGKGSRFVVRLPLAETPASETTPPAAAQGAAKRRVLVVDDNVGAASMLVSLIRKLGSHSVHVAHDGPSALKAAVQQRPEIVLLDIGLPGMDGYQVARRLRIQFPEEQMLLVAVTGYGQNDDRRRSLEAGFDEHLVKPASITNIVGILDHAKLQRD